MLPCHYLHNRNRKLLIIQDAILDMSKPPCEDRFLGPSIPQTIAPRNLNEGDQSKVNLRPETSYDGSVEMTLDEMHRSVATLQEMHECLVRYESTWKQLKELKSYAESEWPMMHFDQKAAEQKHQNLIHELGPVRQEIGKRVDDVTTVLNRFGLPTQWKVYPPPMIGGLIRTQNIFEAFISLESDEDARPTVVRVCDLVRKGIWRCEKDIQEEANKGLEIGSKLSVAPRAIGRVLSWFFPTAKQRSIIGWIIIIGLVLLILRFIFGFHFEQIGQLVVKWAFK